jgi:hypothetical protein
MTGLPPQPNGNLSSRALRSSWSTRSPPRHYYFVVVGASHMPAPKLSSSATVIGMSRRKNRQKAWRCPSCGIGGTSADDPFCAMCGARVLWHPDSSVELHVTGTAAEVESVTRRLTADLAPALFTRTAVQSPPKAKERWARSRKAWAFAIGLTTIAGGVAAVLALFVH